YLLIVSVILRGVCLAINLLDDTALWRVFSLPTCANLDMRGSSLEFVW
ncbi:unnamed protein product, partial [Staurois parvus]